ncbi:MAG TPA: chromate resistance protein ChrB domain-containing protein, partial [Solimonas sp.]|nr:chromate resistance protein ChrB domain-containing protein [Solimonas sp.]
MSEAELPHITVDALMPRLGSPTAPLLVDVRRAADFEAAGRLLAGSIRRGPEQLADWVASLQGRPVVVYCAHGRAVSQGACRELRERGIDAAYLEGGYAAWIAGGGATLRWHASLAEQPSRWVTRERPKIDRIACPWLIRRFIDPLAQFLYVPNTQVLATAAETGATPYDIPDVQFSHRGAACSFDAFLADFELASSALAQLALIVRGADTDRLDLAPQSAGLLAISLGLSALHADDHAMLQQGMAIYDALYAWCSRARGEGHD